MIISSIVAASRNRVIGKDNDIPWHMPNDLKYFKRTTMGHHIIMGRKNFQSFNFPLPKRTNIVVTRNPYFIVSSCIVAHSIEEALLIAKENGEEEAFIIGGGEIYKQSMHLIDRLYFTDIDTIIEGDVFFPEIDLDVFKLISEEQHKADEKNKYDYNFQVYERIK